MAFEFVTRIKSGTTTYVTSSVLQLSPESKFPSFTLLSSNNTLTPSTVRADDTQGITILFQSGTIPTRVDVDIREYITNKNILSLSDVPVTDKILRITSPAADPVLHKA